MIYDVLTMIPTFQCVIRDLWDAAVFMKITPGSAVTMRQVWCVYTSNNCKNSYNSKTKRQLIMTSKFEWNWNTLMK